MNKQVIAGVLGGLVVACATFFPMEVGAIQTGAPTSPNGQIQDQELEKQTEVGGSGSVDEAIDAYIDGTAGTGTAPAPISGPSFRSGDGDDDVGANDDEDHNDEHEDEEVDD